MSGERTRCCDPFVTLTHSHFSHRLLSGAAKPFLKAAAESIRKKKSEKFSAMHEFCR